MIFPAFGFYFARSKEKLQATFLKAFRYIVILSLPLGAGLATLAEPIIKTLWPSYLAVVPTFVVMSAAIPFIFLAFPTGYLLNACDRQKNNTWNRGLITLLALGLNVILIPLYSFYGAGLTFLLTNVILLFLDFWWVKKTIPLNYKILGAIVGKSALAATIMVAASQGLLLGLSIFWVIPLVALLYFLVLFLLKGFSFQEFNLKDTA